MKVKPDTSDIALMNNLGRNDLEDDALIKGLSKILGILFSYGHEMRQNANIVIR